MGFQLLLLNKTLHYITTTLNVLFIYSYYYTTLSYNTLCESWPSGYQGDGLLLGTERRDVQGGPAKVLQLQLSSNTDKNLKMTDISLILHIFQLCITFLEIRHFKREMADNFIYF